MVELKLALDAEFDLVHASKTSEALRALHSGGIDAIVCTIAFDDSRMMDFLQLVKASPATRPIPFICMRVLPGALSDDLVERVSLTCRECGADFLDLARTPRPEALTALRAALGSAAP